MSMYAVVDPATGETVKEYPTITDEELRDAIARAARAHREWWRAATVAGRASLVRRVGELHSERRKELAEIIVAEMGKPVGQARGEVAFCASDTPFGLGSYVMTNDPEQAERVADQIDAGMVYVNIVGADAAELPFGGTKRSGFGRELGSYGADEFVNKKLIRIG